jgi:hydroxymethylbilane synthase
MSANRPFIIATRGSALALVQANFVVAHCRAAFPDEEFEIRAFKTTGDKLLGVSLTESGKSLPKGLFTKELEVALLNGEADLAVHSLKDLPTELPDGLQLAGAPEREDVRDVFVGKGRDVAGEDPISRLPAGATVATSSTRRKCQLLALRPDLNIVEIRGNVGTRLRKVAESDELHGTLLAAAGLKRLGYRVTGRGALEGRDVPADLRAAFLGLDVMLPAVGQAALGLEVRTDDSRAAGICARLNHAPTLAAVTAERAFLRAMGGGCLAPIAAHAEVHGDSIRLRAVWFPGARARRIEGEAPVVEAGSLGRRLAEQLKSR